MYIYRSMLMRPCPTSLLPANVRRLLPRRGGRPAVRYAELHCKTNFSFLEGASHPDELVSRAAELGYAALAVTDRHSLAGVVRAHEAAKEVGTQTAHRRRDLRRVDAPPVVLWATDRASYGRLSQLITRGCRRSEKGQLRADVRRPRRSRRRPARRRAARLAAARSHLRSGRGPG